MTDVLESELLHFRDGPLEAVVNPQGAFVELFRLDDGTNLLAPIREYDTVSGRKLRSTHICMPNFGPAPEESGLHQDGFGREQRWDVIESTALHARLELEIPANGTNGVPPTYNGLHSTLDYSFSLIENRPRFGITLEFLNSGSDPMPVAPGFRPNIAVPLGADRLTITQQLPTKQSIFSAHLSDLAGSHFDHVLAPEAPIQASIGNLALFVQSSENLYGLTYWTDTPEDYVCIEPTARGNAFEAGDNAHPSHMPSLLLPGKSVRYESTFTWDLAA